MSENGKLLSDNVNSDAQLIASIDAKLEQEYLHVIFVSGVWYLVEKDDDKFRIIDEYKNRVAAYAGGLDCVIEACIEAWEKGGDE